MFKIEEDKEVKPKESQLSEFRLELIETMKAMKSGESFVIPRSKVFMFYRERLTWNNPDSFYSNIISKDEVRIFKR